MARWKKPRSRTVRLDPRQVEILERQRAAFRAKFGRDPGPDDPVFFDPKAADPRQLDEQSLVATVEAAMRAAGIDAAKIHAYRRTGMLVTSENLGQWSAEDLDDWQAALDEYESMLASAQLALNGNSVGGASATSGGVVR
jgi:integrase